MAEVFKAGDIDYRMFQTIVYRTDLIADHEVLAAVDGELAVKVPRWPSMTHGRLAGQVDKIVGKADAYAVRRRKERQADRQIWIGDFEGGISEIHGSLFTPDAHALEKRLNALSATVCEHDPRSREQRRADALGLLAAAAVGWAVAVATRLRRRKVFCRNIYCDSHYRRASHDRRQRLGTRSREGRRRAHPT